MFPDSTPTDPIVIFSGRGDSFRGLRAPWDRKIDLMISTSTDSGFGVLQVLIYLPDPHPNNPVAGVRIVQKQLRKHVSRRQ